MNAIGAHICFGQIVYGDPQGSSLALFFLIVLQGVPKGSIQYSIQN